MATLELHRYSHGEQEIWDNFVRSSRNGTFLFERGYMDYHADRFSDYSLVACKGDRPVAMLPADLAVDEDGRRLLRSHGGLTYGGWILPRGHVGAADVVEIFRHVRALCVAEGIDALDYKPLPYIYADMPAQEDLYALFREGARLTERNISCAICLAADPGFDKQQRRNLKRAKEISSQIVETDNVAAFHALLTLCLAERHGVTPVHSCAELQLLRDRFPHNISFFLVETDGMPQAGVCVYDTGTVAHAQYICSTPFGREHGLLTLLFDHLLEEYRYSRYFDFGISNEDHGLLLNEGLYRQKASLGGSGVAYDRYRIDYQH